ncbi:hypothetical protein LGM63_27715 [Burkholderia cepacia]|uniref:hypothetical protein n=1 Tax=Burkholderia TaxID=32008 RepID=UPI001146705C|nr:MULTISPECIES: hypothetical protein [Burkholderia]KAB1594839.1 hypothetical protein C5O75_006165 [Burkholderia cepacia]MCA7994444.1 hypothetical protein [Burkholderia cepacia]MDN7441028.1 hypothetical protein [Burkholderia cepacia]
MDDWGVRKVKLYRVTAAIDDVSGAAMTRTRFGTHTTFNATIDGQRQYAVQILGTVRVESGMIVTAVLRNPNDWQTLEGWRDHQSGRIEGVASIASLRFAAILFGALFASVVVLGFVFRPVAGEHLLAVSMILTFGAATLIPIVGWYQGMQVWRELRLDRR